jgi:predicted alpha/beta hydrolase family esterase
MRVADAEILVVSGWSDSGPEHWQSRWQAKLSTARRVTQRDFEKPMRAEWEEKIVAHSLGVIATLHAAQRVGEKIAGAFLVAPPSEAVIREMPSIDSAFLPIPRARLPFPAAMVGSSDDPYADLLFARHLAQDIGAQFIDAGASGHINVDSGHGPWPEGSLAFANFMAKL